MPPLRAYYVFLFALAVLRMAFLDRSLVRIPIVDLGYSLHLAVSSGHDEAVYTFKNIRYASVNRFARPTYPPPTDRSQIFNGSQQSICPQAYPAWQFSAADFLKGADLSNATMEELLRHSLLPPVTYVNEDCLHLDVQIPKVAFDSIESGRSTSLLPIIVYIHGGGYVQGHKSRDGDGKGLITRATELGSDGVMYVALNYRLGMFGWLFSGDGRVANLGLHDQLVALRWVQEFAYLFGGDANRITILSQSAGAGSTAIHIANSLAQGKSLPFHRAIIQSPYTSLLTSQSQTLTYQKILRNMNASTLEDLRSLDSTKLQDANYAIVGTSAYGSFTFGPVVDEETFAAPLPELLSLTKDPFPLIVGTNSNEGLLFTAPNVLSRQSYLAALKSLLPYFSSDILASITTTLYPPSICTSEIERLNRTLADLLINCSARNILARFAGSSYSYRYSIPSGVHAADLHYTFFDGDMDHLPQKNATIARVFQNYIVSFTLGCSPKADVEGVSNLPIFSDQLGVDLNITGITRQPASWLSETTCIRLREILNSGWS
ncbi:Alpha/Beta hydrolase protein [Xylaria curta]|nr:Alpha/Beta hydrolase protein [Xylaria curta]